MDVRLEVPDDIVHRMKIRWKDLPRGMLQALAILTALLSGPDRSDPADAGDVQ